MYSIDTSKTAEQNLYGLVLDSNPNSHVDQTNVTLGSVIERVPDTNPRDTVILASPITGQGFKGNAVPLRYKRVALNAATPSPVFDYKVRATDEAAAAALKLAIAAGLGVLVSEIKFTSSTPLSEVVAGAAAVQVEVAPITGSFLYNVAANVNVSQDAPGIRVGYSRLGSTFGAYPD